MQNYDLKDITNLPVKIQLIFIGILCGVIFYFGYMWDISSLQKQLTAKKTQEQDLKIQLQALINSQASINNDIAELPILQIKRTEWQSRLVKPSELSDLLNDILKIGTANQLVFDLFNPGEVVKENLYQKIPIKTVVIGDYNHIGEFISQVINMKTIVVIDNFTVQKESSKLYDKKLAEQPGYANRLSAEITLEVYQIAEKQ